MLGYTELCEYVSGVACGMPTVERGLPKEGDEGGALLYSLMIVSKQSACCQESSLTVGLPLWSVPVREICPR